VKPKAFTLIEVMVALVISTMVISGVLLTLQYQFKNWFVVEQKAQMEQMNRGIQNELSRIVRMAGGEMAPGTGGVRDLGEDGLCVIINENAIIWTPMDSGIYLPSSRTFAVAFSKDPNWAPGMVLTVRVNAPPIGSAFGTTRSLDTLLTLKVQRVQLMPDPNAPDTVVFDATNLVSAWNWNGALQAKVNMTTYGGDSICYRRRADTLIRYAQDIYHRADSGFLAIDIDTFKVGYFVLSKGWRTTLANDGTDTLQKVRVRMVVRSHGIDPSLKRQQPATGGYRRLATETEYSLRNWQYIVNR
jgi:prepilin-type N-terminal cleavage/methylation domain-containing protein